ncbi:hypothetical protein BJV77DRAFT_962548 [Russula vinacea]|nr:hypothetical protein BJV77DRAFT_962548 [Russula vinacea]
MAIAENIVPSINYAVNVRCVQVIQKFKYQKSRARTPRSAISWKPLSGESCSRSWSQTKPNRAAKRNGSARTRSYFSIQSDVPCKLGHRDKLSALGIDMEDRAIADIDRSSAQGTLIDVIVYVLTSEGWNHQTEVTELVKTALVSLGNSENQPAIDAFNHAAVRDATGATVQTLSADDSGDISFAQTRAGSLCVTTVGDIFSPKTTSEQFSIQYRISSGILERDFADRTTRVIIEKAAPFYADSQCSS